MIFIRHRPTGRIWNAGRWGKGRGKGYAHVGDAKNACWAAMENLRPEGGGRAPVAEIEVLTCLLPEGTVRTFDQFMGIRRDL